MIVRTPNAVAAPVPPLPPTMFSGAIVLAGAELTPVDAMADYFGTDHGLLIVRLAPGTPADRAGLRSGDVILGADGQEVRTIRALQVALTRSEDHSLKLDVLRKKEKKVVTLSW
jgi:S1-C subfamily serine protease